MVPQSDHIMKEIRLKHVKVSNLDHFVMLATIFSKYCNIKTQSGIIFSE